MGLMSSLKDTSGSHQSVLLQSDPPKLQSAVCFLSYSFVTCFFHVMSSTMLCHNQGFLQFLCYWGFSASELLYQKSPPQNQTETTAFPIESQRLFFEVFTSEILLLFCHHLYIFTILLPLTCFLVSSDLPCYCITIWLLCNQSWEAFLLCLCFPSDR